MARRFACNTYLNRLLSILPIEAGVGHLALVSSVLPRIPHKTFAHLCGCSASSLEAQQLLAVSRMAESHLKIEAAEVLRMARIGQPPAFSRLARLTTALVVERCPKEIAKLSQQVESLAAKAKKIYLLDRGNSFEVFQPSSEDTAATIVAKDSVIVPKPIARGRRHLTWRYERRPRIIATLTDASLILRRRCHGDEGIEPLLAGVERGDYSITIVKDDRRVEHRVLGEVFADATAVAIFDARYMVVLPSHEHSFRLYDSRTNPDHKNIIRESIRQLRYMRGFRVHDPCHTGIVSYLRRLLSYRLPSWDRQHMSRRYETSSIVRISRQFPGAAALDPKLHL